MNRLFYYLFLIIIIASPLAVSCGPSPVTAIPPATSPNTLIPASATSVPPTVTLPPTATPQPTVPPPTATHQPPTATTAPSPTAVPPTPVPSNTPTLEPATPTLVPTIPAEPGGENNWGPAEGLATIPAEASPTPGGSSLDAIIPPGAGRELLFSNCTSCHSFVCSVIGQRSEGSWLTIRKGHADRVSALSEADQDVLYSYLFENFGDSKPEPQLPPELKEQGCSAQ